MDRRVMLTTDRLVFATWRDRDLDDLHALHVDPRVQRSYGPEPEKWTREGIAARLALYRREQAEYGFTKWRMTLRDGTYVGRGGWSPWETDGVEIGYALRPTLWGQGYGGEAAQALLAWARTNVTSRTRAGFALTHNAPSRRILETIGLTFTDLRLIAGVENAYNVDRG